MHALLKEIDAVPTPPPFRPGGADRGPSGRGDRAPPGAISLGGQVQLTGGSGKEIPCEVVGFRDGRALVMPLGNLDGMTLGARADFDDRPAVIYPSTAWLGRVIDGFGKPDGRQGPARRKAAIAYPLKAQPPPAACARARRRQARSRRARAQRVRDLLQGPAHGHLLRLRRRQVDTAGHARAQHRMPMRSSSAWSANAAAR